MDSDIPKIDTPRIAHGVFAGTPAAGAAQDYHLCHLLLSPGFFLPSSVTRKSAYSELFGGPFKSVSQG